MGNTVGITSLASRHSVVHLRPRDIATVAVERNPFEMIPGPSLCNHQSNVIPFRRLQNQKKKKKCDLSYAFKVKKKMGISSSDGIWESHSMQLLVSPRATTFIRDLKD